MLESLGQEILAIAEVVLEAQAGVVVVLVFGAGAEEKLGMYY